MDISYLLWWQGIRESLPEVVEHFFVVVSALAVHNALVLIPCLLFWCLDKRAGRYLILTFSIGTLLNQLIKNTVCCYRPWIRDAAVRPAEGALAEATGYSFPSGHTQGAACLFGSIGWYYRKRWPALLALCSAFVLLVGFSRNFLGVHTPQDVLVALAEGVVVLLVVERLLAWIDEADGRDARVLVVCLTGVAAYMLYVWLKPYPMDYDAAGALVVDPVVMQVDCFKAAGVFLGAMLGWFLEKRYVNFAVDPRAMGWKRLLVRFAIGMAVLVACHLAPRVFLLVGTDERIYEFAKNFSTFLGGVYVAPLVFSAVERRRSRREEPLS